MDRTGRWLFGMFAGRARRENQSEAIHARIVAVVPSEEARGMLRIGVRPSPDDDWQWVEVDLEGAAWFADRIGETAREVRKKMDRAPSKLVRVPNVVGQDRDVAVDHLERSGFTVQVVNDPDTFDTRVARQEPPANAPVPPDRVVVMLRLGA